MYRTRERRHRLPAGRVRLDAPARHAFYVVMATLIGSGIWWLGVHYATEILGSGHDEWHRVAHEALALKVHGATAFVALLALGAMGACHAWRGWHSRRNRISGSMVVIAFAVLAVTGYALYYLVSDTTHSPVSILHWVSGLVVAPMLALHISTGRRGRERIASECGRLSIGARAEGPEIIPR